MTEHSILIVEDNEIAQKVAVLVLTQLRCYVSIAGDGTSALKLFEENNYDFIFIDLGLPDIDGFTVTQQIRASEKVGSHIPIVALTANRDKSLETQCITAGMDDYMLKPLTRDKAVAILSKWLNQ